VKKAPAPTELAASLARLRGLGRSLLSRLTGFPGSDTWPQSASGAVCCSPMSVPAPPPPPRVEYNPLFPYGILVRWKQSDEDDCDQLGTCFAYKRAHCFVTARHCIPVDGIERVAVVPQPATIVPNKGRPVVSVELHPAMDAALVVVQPIPGEYQHVFTGPEQGMLGTIGDEVCAFGYPANDPGEPALTTPRFFRGYYQRSMRFTSPEGYTYWASELSFPAPRGLSGGAVYKRHRFPEVSGIVTTNYESYTGSEHEVIERHGGVTEIVRYRRVVTYGIALMMHEVAAWLEEAVARYA
jgi:hypothetical protein